MMLRVFVFFMGLMIAFRVDAQALPAFSGAVNKALGQTIEKAAVRRGFAANDPRMVATFTGASTVAAGIAADVAIAAATAASAPVWLSLAAGLGAAAVVGGLAYGAYKLFFDDSSSQAKFIVQMPGGAPIITKKNLPTGNGDINNPVPTTGNVAQGSLASFTDKTGTTSYARPGTFFDLNYVLVSSNSQWIPKRAYLAGLWIYAESAAMAIDAFTVYYRNEIGAAYAGGPSNPCQQMQISGSTATQKCTIQWKISQSGSLNTAEVEFQLVANPYNPPTGNQTVKGPIADIYAQLPASELAKDADPATVALLANNLWQRAASQPGYQGLPYSASEPVTVADAQAAQAANPASWPKNSDLVSPVASAANQPVTVSPTMTSPAPGTDTGTNPSPGVGTNVNVVNNPGVNILNTPNVHIDGAVDVNWGNAPSVQEPSINNTPTAQQIFAPLTGLMPTLKNFVVPSHQSTCPTPQFDMFGRSILMDGHCKVLEPVRPTLFSVMAFVWLMVGTVIILRA